MTPPIMTISAISGGGVGLLRFALQGPISDGYTNELKPDPEKQLTHPGLFLWEKGSIDDLEIELTLAVGVSLEIETPQDLIDCVSALTSMAIADGKKKKLVKTSIRIGKWFDRAGYIKSVKVKFDAPWDVDTGMPMIATVTLIHTADYSSAATGKTQEALLPQAPWDYSKVGAF